MKRLDRRTFLVNSMRTGAVVVAAGSVGYYEWELFQPASSTAAKLPGAPVALKINGEPSPVGVDPDDVSFAWQVSDPRKGAIQSAYRLMVSLAGDGGATVWDSAEVVSGRQAFVGYTGPTLESDTAYLFAVATRDAHGVWSRASEPAHFVTGLRQRRLGCAMAPPRPCGHGSREVHLPANDPRSSRRGDSACRRLYRGRPQVPAVAERPKGRHGTELLLPRRAVRTGDRREQGTRHWQARNAFGFLHHWYSAGKGRPQSAPGLLAQLSVRFSDGRRFVVGTGETWKRARSRVAARSTAEHRRRRLRRDDRSRDRARRVGRRRPTTTATGARRR